MIPGRGIVVRLGRSCHYTCSPRLCRGLVCRGACKSHGPRQSWKADGWSLCWWWRQRNCRV
jgi:hypothetical protein